jgi:flagellar motor switch protein FliG
MERIIAHSSAQKAVAAIVAIGQPQASDLIKHLSRAEVGRLIAASKTMKAVTQDGLELIVSDFEKEFTRGTGLFDSSMQIDSILSESFDSAEMALLNGENETVAKPKMQTRSAWEVLAESEASQIVEFLAIENPQVGAFVLSRLPPARAADILALMERQDRTVILSRMMSLTDVSREAEMMIEDELLSQFSKAKTGSNKATLSLVAAILNDLERTAAEELLGDLAASVEPDELVTVKSMLFRFDDIVHLEASARASVFDAVQVDVLTMALRHAEAEVAEAALTAISQRSRRMVENDLKSTVPVRPADVADARKRIVSQVMRLAAEGRIDLPKSESLAA